MSRDGITQRPVGPSADLQSDLRAIVEVATPLRVSHAWIAFACQKAGLTRPRWDHELRIWSTTTTSKTPSTLSITCPGGDRTLRVEAGGAHEEAVRRFVSAVLTGMFQRTRQGSDLPRPRS